MVIELIRFTKINALLGGNVDKVNPTNGKTEKIKKEMNI